MEKSPNFSQTNAPTATVAQRYHDLDALRAFAMLLGIVLHGALSFFPMPIWPAQDLHQPEVEVPALLAASLEQAGLEVPETYSPYEFMLHAIHGFRLPLFFLVSGFFTAMLWRKRGLRQLAKHRTKRILLPLAIFVPLTWILMIVVGMEAFVVPAGHFGENGEESSHEVPAGLIGLIFFAPVFHHLWFLYYLIWLVAGFILIMWSIGKLKLKALPDRLVTSPVCWLWLLPATFLPQLLMKKDFGPATATGALPWPPILVYYVVFFFFGALCFGRDWFNTKAGKLWPLSFVLAVPPLLAGLCLVKSQQNDELLAACSVAYAWLMILGCIGFFRYFFSGENPRIRYLSDASYWLYIMHLSVIMCLQSMVSTWNIPSLPKFLIVCVATTVPLLLIYEFGVRYTFIGTMLNGRRTRTLVTDT